MLAYLESITQTYQAEKLGKFPKTHNKQILRQNTTPRKVTHSTWICGLTQPSFNTDRRLAIYNIILYYIYAHNIKLASYQSVPNGLDLHV